MSIVSITGSVKLYRSLLLATNGKDPEWMEDVEDGDPRLTPDQNETVGAIGRGDFKIEIAADGLATLTITS